MRTVRLYGWLGNKYGREFKLDIKSPAEAIRALCANFAGFESDLVGAEKRGIRFAVFDGDRAIHPDRVRTELPMHGSDTIRIAPVIVGTKRGGILTSILGVVLIVIGVILSYVPGGQAAAPYFYQAGIALLLGGIVQLLTPVPKTNTNNSGSGSAIFSGPQNTTAQGVAVPIVLGGPILCGSVVISAGVSVDDIQVEAPTAVLSANKQSGTAPFTVTFTGSNSTTPTGNITKLDFDFGDGTFLELPANYVDGVLSVTTDHTYTTPGHYTAALIVWNDSGIQSSAANLTIDIS